MPTTLKRMTFTATPDMIPIMDRAKRKYHDRTQSEMIRLLIEAGLNSLNANNEKARPKKGDKNRLLNPKL